MAAALQRDTSQPSCMSAPEALIFRQFLCTDATDSAFEQGWLLRTLHDDDGLALDTLARRFDRNVSWVSLRRSLVRTLHRGPIGGVEQRIETASLVLCYSRLLFFQAYAVFTRFYCKVFLTDALEYVIGAPRRA